MIIINPVNIIFFFASLGIDIAMFFLIARLLLLCRHNALLNAICEIGDPLTQLIVDGIKEKLNERLSERGCLLIAIMILSATKILLILLTNN